MAFTPKTKEFTSKEKNKYKFQTVMNSVHAQIEDDGSNDSGKTLNSNDATSVGAYRC